MFLVLIFSFLKEFMSYNHVDKQYFRLWFLVLNALFVPVTWKAISRVSNSIVQF